jgi:hypothetical protein
MGTTNFDTVDCDELNVAGVDVTAAMAEVATINGLTASAAELNKLDNCTVTTAELNLLDEAPGLCTFVTAAGAANVAETTITVKDAAGAAVTRPTFVHVWLSGDANGLGVTSHAADTFAVKTGEGTSFGATNAAGTGLLAQTKANGTLVIQTTDTHKTAQFIAALPVGKHVISVGTITVTTDYGA